MIVGRGVLTSQFYEDLPPPIVPPSLFSSFVQSPPSMFLQHLPPLLILLSCFFDWMGDRATFDVLFYSMITWMYPCRALGPLYVFYATRHQIGVSTPLQIHPPPPFFCQVSPPLKTAQAPLYQQILPIHWFFVNLPLKIGLFSVPP